MALTLVSGTALAAGEFANNRRLAEIIHGPNVTRSVSEGVVTVRPRLRSLKLRYFDA